MYCASSVICKKGGSHALVLSSLLKESNKKSLMLDATFWCVGKTSSGKSHEIAKHLDIFLDQRGVDLFVEKHIATFKEKKEYVEFCLIA